MPRCLVVALATQPAYKSGRLTLHSADLDNPGCFDEIFKGCNGVLHLHLQIKYWTYQPL